MVKEYECDASIAGSGPPTNTTNLSQGRSKIRSYAGEVELQLQAEGGTLGGPEWMFEQLAAPARQCKSRTLLDAKFEHPGLFVYTHAWVRPLRTQSGTVLPAAAAFRYVSTYAACLTYHVLFILTATVAT